MDKKIARRKGIGIFLVAVFFSLYHSLPYIGVDSIEKVAIRFIVFWILFMVVLPILWKTACIVIPKLHCAKVEKRIYHRWTDRRFFLTVWLILIVGWLPTYLAFFPGIFGYDAPVQLEQIVGNQPYSAHHPFFHTIVLGVFLNVGKMIFGNYNGGIALFCISQGLVVSASIAYSFIYMKRHNTPFPIAVLSLLWCLCYPMLKVLTFNITKDVLFGAVLLCFVMQCHNWIESRQKKTALQTILFLLTGILVCLLRNQGIYVILALFLISMFVVWKNKKFLICLAGIIVFSQLFFVFSTSVLNVQKGDAREMLSVPMQQMTVVCKAYLEGQPVNLTQEEFDKFATLVAPEYISNYIPDTADPIKSYFNTAMLFSDLPGYIRLYFSIGIHNPGGYMTAFRCMVEPYWDMTKNGAKDLIRENTFPMVSEQYGISQQSCFPRYQEHLSSLLDHTPPELKKPWQIISWLLRPGLCIWIITALVGIAIAFKDRVVFLVTMVCMVFFGTLMLGPTALVRYLYPLMIMIPWLLALLIGKVDEGNETLNRRFRK